MPIRSLAEQIDQQRGLHGREGPASCAGGLGLPCLRDTVWLNTWRAALQLPVSLVVLLGLAALGALPREGPRLGSAVLLLPIALALPAWMLIGFMHRYALPVVPLAALLSASGLLRVASRGDEGGPGWPRPAFLGAMTLLWAIGALMWTGTLSARARGYGGRPGAAPIVPARQVTALTLTERAVGAAARPGDDVVDCAHTGLAVRLYPLPVETWRGAKRTQNDRCHRVYAQGPGQTAMVLAFSPEPDAVRWSGWTEVARFERGHGLPIVVVRTP